MINFKFKNNLKIILKFKIFIRALLDFFKKKSSLKKKKPAKISAPQKIQAGKEKKPKEIKVELKPEAKPKKKPFDRAHRILYSPHITEKATDLEKQNKYIFKVWPRANKIEIKETIEHTYGVDVLGVRIINIPRRKRRLGRKTGWKKGYKKAIVKVKEGQKIEILPR